MQAQGFAESTLRVSKTLALKYEGTDTAIELALAENASAALLRATFETIYRKRYGFLMPGRELVIEAITAEAIGLTEPPTENYSILPERTNGLQPRSEVDVFCNDAMRRARVFYREELRPDDRIDGPAIIREAQCNHDGGTGVVRMGHETESSCT